MPFERGGATNFLHDPFRTASRHYFKLPINIAQQPNRLKHVAMASKEPPMYQRAIKFGFDVAAGRHALSVLVPVALWLVDAILCGLVIWKVPCTEIPARQLLRPQANFLR